MKFNFNHFYCIRHGQTDANLGKYMSGGEDDIPLNQTGIDQAQKIADFLAKYSIDAEIVYCSPMKRAKKTAEILNQELNKKIRFLNDLKEWCVGDWSQVLWKDIPVNIFNTTMDPPNGESIAEFNKRTLRAFNIINQERKIPLIVSHGAFLYYMMKNIGIPLDKDMQNSILYKVEKNASKKWEYRIISK